MRWSQSLTDWFRTPVTAPTRSELAIKILLAVTAEREDVRDIIQHQRTATMELLQKYTRHKRDAHKTKDMPWLLALDALILKAEAEIRWLDLCEQRLKLAKQSEGK